MHLLYIIFIYPLELFMKTILEFSYSITNNYGWSIIILSIIVNIILLPLYYMAERWKAKDKLIQDKMKPEINNIKKYYKGQERHYYIQAIYRRYRYHPLSSIKASVGFLIQIPFFFAAFHLLSNYQALNGVSFGVIKNLGTPDHLLGGVNLLPIIMTIVNLLSAYIYIELLSKSEKIQLFTLAFIFLVVLYTEPAGLLLYWTMNNVFSLFKNIIEKKLKLGPLFSKTFKRSIEKKSILNKAIFEKIYQKIQVPIWFYILITAIGLDRVYNFHFEKTNFLYALESIIIFLYLDFILIMHYLKQERNNKLFSIIIFTLFLIAIIFISDNIFHTFLITSSTHLKENAIIVLSSIFLLLTFHKTIYFKSKAINRLFSPSTNLFLLSYLSLFMLLFVINPITLYLSTDDFTLSLKDLLFNISIALISGMVISYILYYLTDKVIKSYIIILGIILLFLSIAYSFLIVKDYGLMDHFVFNVPTNLIINVHDQILELILLTFAIFIITFIIIRYTNLVSKAITVILIGFLLLTTTYISKILTKSERKISKISPIESNIESEIATTLAFSKEKNVLVFFLDGFSGGDLATIFKDEKNILSEYTGFVNYKNVLTMNNGTGGSILSMFGGKNFSVNAINKRDNESLKKKSEEAYNVFAKAFIPQKWDLTYFHPQSAFNIDKKINVPIFNYSKYYLKSFKIGNNLPENNDFKMILYVSFFKALPLSLKNIFYLKKIQHQNNNKVSPYIKEKAKYWGFLNILLDNMIFSSKHKTLKYIHLSIPHRPHLIGNDGFLHNASSYHTEAVQSLKKLGEIFKKMKDNKIYDQSKIIVVSDHGWWRENINFPEYFEKYIPKGIGNRMNIGMINPILLIKDFNTTGSIKTSNKLMSNSDVPAIICSVLKNGCNIKDEDPTKKDINRTLTISTVISPNFYEDNIFNIGEQYKVHTNIFNPNNWEKIK